MFCEHCGIKLDEGAQFCQSCGHSTDIAQVSSVEYFAIAPGRLAFFSVITYGIYEIYWFYKNWQAVKKSEQSKISPLFRAIFSIFFCHSLFKKILESSRASGYKNAYSPGWLAAVYIILLLLGNALSRVETYDFGFNLLWLALVVSTFIPLVFVQKAINYNNEKIEGVLGLHRGFSGGEVALIVIGVILFLLSFWGIFIP
jgi:hypothetical protein